MTAAPPRFRYEFRFADGTRNEFVIDLDPETLAIRGDVPDALPDWTRLGHHQCPICPLEEASSPRCPIAVRIVPVVEAFRNRLSYEEAEVVVETPHRTYLRRAPLQKTLGSLLGIYNVVSGCPILDRLRPMVGTHLPFSTPEETTYRTTTMYLLAQFFRARKGLEPDWTLKGLVDLLGRVMKVNVAFGARLRSAVVQDAALNALVTLANFGTSTSMTLEMDDLKRLEDLFETHLG